MNKICIKCGLEKKIYDFRQGKNQCIICMRKQQKEYRDNNKQKIKLVNKSYYENNKDLIKIKQKKYAGINSTRKATANKIYYETNKKIILKKQKKYYENNKEQSLNRGYEYRKNNKEKINLKNNIRLKDRRASDPIFKLRTRLSSSIRNSIKRRNKSKKGSILDFLPYTLDQLKTYIESLFEPWMNWNNWSKYNAKTWDDNDRSTWVWNLDHIIPHHYFNYSSMEDDEFKQCWALENLRPLSAKQNIIDGVRDMDSGI